MLTHRANLQFQAGLLILALAAAADADTIPRVFLDDFADGDAFDGAPVTWTTAAAFPGNYHVRDADFVFADSENSLMSARVDAHVLTDVSIVTRFRMLDDELIGFGLNARRVLGDGTGYYCNVDINSEVLELWRLDGGRTSRERLSDVPLSFPVTPDEDVMLRFDVVGDRISAWVWRPGTPMPAAPTRSAADDTYSSGFVSIFIDPPGGLAPGDQGAFRFVRISRPGAGFHDDFEDGNASDAAPATWTPSPHRPGDYGVSDGHYVLKLPQNADGILAAAVRDEILADSSVMAQLRALGPVDFIGVSARRNPDAGTSYLGGIVPATGELLIAQRDGPDSGSTLAVVPSPLDVFADDLLMRLDCVGSDLSLWAWPPGEPMPTTPQVIASDATYATGAPGVFAAIGSAEGTGEAVFRFVDVSGFAVTAPELIAVCPGLGEAANPDHDVYVSPAAPSAGGLTEIEVAFNESVRLVGPICLKSTGSSPPASAAWSSFGTSGPNVYRVTFSDPVELGEWTTASVTVENAFGVQADVCFHVGWLPDDCDQNFQVSMHDATAFGTQFNGDRNPKAADLNGDGQVNLADATKYGQTWHGTSGEAHPAGGGWNGKALPDGDGLNGRQPPPCGCP